jgi:hypothetical protein
VNAAELSDPNNWRAAQKAMEHLQRCLMALEKIKSISGPGPIAALADGALLNKPPVVGGGDY